MAAPAIRGARTASKLASKACAVAMPAGSAAGDYVVMFAVCRYNGVNPKLKTPAGWELRAESAEHGLTTNKRITYLFARVLTSTADVTLESEGALTPAGIYATAVGIVKGTYDTAAPVNVHSAAFVVVEGTKEPKLTATPATTRNGTRVIAYQDGQNATVEDKATAAGWTYTSPWVEQAGAAWTRELPGKEASPASTAWKATGTTATAGYALAINPGAEHSDQGRGTIALVGVGHERHERVYDDAGHGGLALAGAASATHGYQDSATARMSLGVTTREGLGFADHGTTVDVAMSGSATSSSEYSDSERGVIAIGQERHEWWHAPGVYADHGAGYLELTGATVERYQRFVTWRDHGAAVVVIAGTSHSGHGFDAEGKGALALSGRVDEYWAAPGLRGRIVIHDGSGARTIIGEDAMANNVGDLWRPWVRVLNPDLEPDDPEAPLELPASPSVRVIDPYGVSSTTRAWPEEHRDGWRPRVQITTPGIWTIVVTVPSPFDDVEVARKYFSAVP